MWRGRATSFSTNTEPSPNAARRLAPAAGEGRGHLVVPATRAHAATAAARGRLQHHRIADRCGSADRLVGVRQGIGAAGNDRDAERARQLAGLGLVAEQRQRLGTRADEGDGLFEASLREVGDSRTGSRSRDARSRSQSLGGLDQRLDVEVGAHRIAPL